MRAAAKVHPVALRIHFQALVGGNSINKFDFERFALGFEMALGLIACPLGFGKGGIARDDLAHLFLDGRKLFRCKRRRAEKIVIKPVLNHRADGDLRAGIQRLHRLSQHMGGIMADQFKRARVFTVQKFNSGVGSYRIGKVAHHTIERHRNGALGQGRRNAFDNFKAGNVLGVLTNRAVRKSHIDHL